MAPAVAEIRSFLPCKAVPFSPYAKPYSKTSSIHCFSKEEIEYHITGNCRTMTSASTSAFCSAGTSNLPFTRSLSSSRILTLSPNRARTASRIALLALEVVRSGCPEIIRILDIVIQSIKHQNHELVSADSSISSSLPPSYISTLFPMSACEHYAESNTYC